MISIARFHFTSNSDKATSFTIITITISTINNNHFFYCKHSIDHINCKQFNVYISNQFDSYFNDYFHCTNLIKYNPYNNSFIIDFFKSKHNFISYFDICYIHNYSFI